jgi:hypothetical protein
MDDIDLPGAWDANNFDVRRILQSHGTCQVRCGVASEIAAECNDDRLKVFAHNLLAEKSWVDLVDWVDWLIGLMEFILFILMTQKHRRLTQQIKHRPCILCPALCALRHALCPPFNPSAFRLPPSDFYSTSSSKASTLQRIWSSSYQLS